MKGRRALLLLLLIAAIAAAAFAWVQNRQFDRRILALRDTVLSDASQAAGSPDLPAIVRDFAIRNGGRVGASSPIHLTHRARLSTAAGRPPIDITADQWLSPTTSGMVWYGRGAMFGIPVSVVDSIVGSKGLLEARLLGTVTVAKGEGGDFDKGELQRYLSELPLHPDAILNNAGLAWRQIDDETVEVADGTASVRFTFDSGGDITGMRADDRPMTVGSRTVPTPWVGTYSEYRSFGPYRIPSFGEVGWALPEGTFSYWKGTVTNYEVTDSRGN